MDLQLDSLPGPHRPGGNGGERGLEGDQAVLPDPTQVFVGYQIGLGRQGLQGGPVRFGANRDDLPSARWTWPRRIVSQAANAPSRSAVIIAVAATLAGSLLTTAAVSAWVGPAGLVSAWTAFVLTIPFMSTLMPYLLGAAMLSRTSSVSTSD
jgi:hypothetical protein